MPDETHAGMDIRNVRAARYMHIKNTRASKARVFLSHDEKPQNGHARARPFCFLDRR
jgi:hypothetical protein